MAGNTFLISGQNLRVYVRRLLGKVNLSPEVGLTAVTHQCLVQMQTCMCPAHKSERKNDIHINTSSRSFKKLDCLVLDLVLALPISKAGCIRAPESWNTL